MIKGRQREMWGSGDYAAIATPLLIVSELLCEAVELQDALPYTEPPPWYFPNREALGHALLQAGRADEAEAVFAKQLAYTPRNGWSLFGLAASQRAQGDLSAAQASDAQLSEVWERADFQLEAAVF